LDFVKPLDCIMRLWKCQRNSTDLCCVNNVLWEHHIVRIRKSFIAKCIAHKQGIYSYITRQLKMNTGHIYSR